MVESLHNLKAKQIEYRLLINGEPSYTKLTAMLTKDGEHILICVENINERVIEYTTLSRKANHDELTGARNKNAYKDYEAALNKEIEAAGDVKFAILVCDINNLKKINDSLGHIDGDKYIKNACLLICNTFVHSPVFRIGGDEFVVVIRGSDYAEKDELVRKFQSIVSYNATYDVTPDRPVIASGMCEFSRDKHSCVADVFNKADKLMYDNKIRLKRI